MIGGRAQENAVCPGHLRQDGLEIVLNDAAAGLDTAVTALAAMNGLVAQPDQFGLRAQRLGLLQGKLQIAAGVPRLPGASANGQQSHIGSSNRFWDVPAGTGAHTGPSADLR